MINTAIEAAIKAGEAILEIYEQDFEVEFKADESPLTAADKASHEIIEEALNTTPYPVLSEESGSVSYEERSRWTTYWLVDPLDGTKEFIKKNGEFTVNIALIENGVPIAGVVYVPVEQTLYLGLAHGIEGMERGAFKADSAAGKSFDALKDLFKPIRVSGSPKGSLKVVASKSHCNDETREFIAALQEKYGDPELVSRGSSLKLCMVAEGRADIYPRIAPTMEWDTAAAHAVVSAAGGAVFEYDDKIDATGYGADCNEAGYLAYNKENLLNPYFVVSGLHK
jgi:3'(2'), 5'-bisphosphate nucleotidase